MWKWTKMPGWNMCSDWRLKLFRSFPLTKEFPCIFELYQKNVGTLRLTYRLEVTHNVHNLEDRLPPEPLFFSFFPILQWQKETGRLVSAENKKNEYNSWKTILWKTFHLIDHHFFICIIFYCLRSRPIYPKVVRMSVSFTCSKSVINSYGS